MCKYSFRHTWNFPKMWPYEYLHMCAVCSFILRSMASLYLMCLLTASVLSSKRPDLGDGEVVDVDSCIKLVWLGQLRLTTGTDRCHTSAGSRSPVISVHLPDNYHRPWFSADQFACPRSRARSPPEIQTDRRPSEPSAGAGPANCRAGRKVCHETDTQTVGRHYIASSHKAVSTSTCARRQVITGSCA